MAALAISLLGPVGALADPPERHPLDPLGANFEPAHSTPEDGPRQPRLPSSLGDEQDDDQAVTRAIQRDRVQQRRQADDDASEPAPGGSVADRIAAAWPGDDAKALRVARCESGLNPSAYNGAGPYYGLFQFDVRTWRSVGGSGLPSEASVEEQTERAWALRSSSGWGPWPVCGRS